MRPHLLQGGAVCSFRLHINTQMELVMATKKIRLVDRGNAVEGTRGLPFGWFWENAPFPFNRNFTLG